MRTLHESIDRCLHPTGAMHNSHMVRCVHCPCRVRFGVQCSGVRPNDVKRDDRGEAMNRKINVTMVRDATADYSDEAMHAALDVNIPNYANAVVTTSELVESISSLAEASAQKPGGGS